jgi:hypothetical protein
MNAVRGSIWFKHLRRWHCLGSSKNTKFGFSLKHILLPRSEYIHTYVYMHRVHIVEQKKAQNENTSHS